jgi:excisionase family DNA binding protein
MVNENFLTLEEMAETLKVPKSWLYSRTREIGPGTIPRVKVGKYLRFRLEEVMKWLEEGQRGQQ